MGKHQALHTTDSNLRWFLTGLFVLLSTRPISVSSSNDHRQRLETLRTHLMSNYSGHFAPLQKVVDTFPVQLQYYLVSLLDLNAADQKLTALNYFGVVWNDTDLAWNHTKEGSLGEGISSLHFRSEEIWTPRLVVVNMADGGNQVMTDYASVLVFPSGMCIAHLPLQLSTTCKMDVTYYPFDTQNCSVILTPLFGDQLILIGSVTDLDLSLYYDSIGNSGEWEVESITPVNTMITFPPSNINMDYVSFRLTLRRRSLFYVLTVIFPMGILSLTGAFGFLLPVQCGEKVSFQVAIMVSLSVFLSFINDAMPKTSNSTSRLALYLDLLMLQSCLSLLATLAVLRGHYHLEKLDTLDKEKRVLSTPPGDDDNDDDDDGDGDDDDDDDDDNDDDDDDDGDDDDDDGDDGYDDDDDDGDDDDDDDDGDNDDNDDDDSDNDDDDDDDAATAAAAAADGNNDDDDGDNDDDDNDDDDDDDDDDGDNDDNDNDDVVHPSR
ncbi:hypothetical protein ACOMHN_061580 [Nucella lapillus]